MKTLQTVVETKSEFPGLPPGWANVKIGDILTLEYGKSLTKDARNENGQYPVFGSSGVVGYHDKHLVTAPVLIVGRKGGVGQVFRSDKDCWPIDTVYFVRLIEGLSVRFCYYLLRFLDLRQYDRSTAIPGLNRNDVYDIGISIPPVREQDRIVEKIEELFSDLDAGVDALKLVRQQLEAYRQTVLKSAFDGKLTANWRTQNKHLSLSTSITRCKDSGELTKTISLPKLPEEWGYVTIDDLLSTDRRNMVTGPFGTALKKQDHRSTGVPVLGIENIGNGVFISGNKIFVTPSKAQELQPFRVCAGDVIISRSGTVGEICMVPVGIGECLISTNLIKLSLQHTVIDPQLFVYFFQKGSPVRQQVKELCKGSTRDFLNQAILRSIKFPFMGSLEQKQVLAEIDSRFSVCDELEKAIDSAFYSSEALRRSILKLAFAGQLVPHDPTDVPASELLQRIAECRLHQTKKSTPRKKEPSAKKKSRLFVEA